MANKRNRFTQVLWFIICLIGNGLQVYYIVRHYFLYEISTNVQLYIPDTVNIPSVTLCFDYHQLLKWKAMTSEEVKKLLLWDGTNIMADIDLENIDYDKLPVLMEELSSIEKGLILSNLHYHFNHSDIFRLTISSDDLIEISAIFSPKYKELHFRSVLRKRDNDTDPLTFVDFFKDIRKCFMANAIEKYIKNVSFYDICRQDINMGEQSTYKFKDRVIEKSNMTNGIIALTENGQVLRSGFYSFLLIDPSRMSTISYSEYRTTLLPVPFETKCSNYMYEDEDDGIRTRPQCYEACIRKKTLGKFRKIYPSLSIFPNETTPAMTIYEVASDFEKLRSGNGESILRNSISECMDICSRRDCINVIYIPRLIGKGERKDVSVYTYKRGISLFISTTPVTEATCQPQVTIIQVLTYVASTFGFWFGLSMMGVANLLKNLRSSCHKTRTNSKPPLSTVRIERIINHKIRQLEVELREENIAFITSFVEREIRRRRLKRYHLSQASHS